MPPVAGEPGLESVPVETGDPDGEPEAFAAIGRQMFAMIVRQVGGRTMTNQEFTTHQDKIFKKLIAQFAEDQDESKMSATGAR